MIQQSAAQWDRDLADRVGHEAEVTDADEVLGQDVEEKASDELIDLENHDAGRIAGFAIGPSKLDLVAVKSDQEVVGDGDPVGVSAQILQDLLGPARDHRRELWSRRPIGECEVPGSRLGTSWVRLGTEAGVESRAGPRPGVF